MLNVFVITFDQPSITVLEILGKNVKKLLIRGNKSYKESSDDFGLMCEMYSLTCLTFCHYIWSAIYYGFWDIRKFFFKK